MWTNKELNLFHKLNSTESIQNFLDDISYDARDGTSSPRYVIKDGTANCFEGALFAACALEHLGHKPLIVDMVAHNDDDHVLAIFKYYGHLGAIAKSNTTVLRYREPVYKSVRELIMSYFDLYINTLGEKTLRLYSTPMNLHRFDKKNWRTTDQNLDYIGDALGEMKHFKVLSPSLMQNLSKANPLLLKATLLGSNEEGLYRPKK
jgi:hypothetical protein